MNKQLNAIGDRDVKFEVRFPKGKGWNKAFASKGEATNYARFFRQRGRPCKVVKVESTLIDN